MEIPKTLLYKTMGIGAITVVAGGVIGLTARKIYSDSIRMNSYGYSIAKGSSHCHDGEGSCSRDNKWVIMGCGSEEGTYYRYVYDEVPADQLCTLQVENLYSLTDKGCDQKVDSFYFFDRVTLENTTPESLRAASRTLREYRGIFDVDKVHAQWKNKYTLKQFR